LYVLTDRTLFTHCWQPSSICDGRAFETPHADTEADLFFVAEYNYKRLNGIITMRTKAD
jgi:hypothetical protein